MANKSKKKVINYRFFIVLGLIIFLAIAFFVGEMVSNNNPAYCKVNDKQKYCDENDYIGLGRSEAFEKAKSKGLTVREIKSGPLLTPTGSSTRLNLRFVDDKVSSASFY